MLLRAAALPHAVQSKCAYGEKAIGMGLWLLTFHCTIGIGHSHANHHCMSNALHCSYIITAVLQVSERIITNAELQLRLRSNVVAAYLHVQRPNYKLGTPALFISLPNAASSSPVACIHDEMYVCVCVPETLS